VTCGRRSFRDTGPRAAARPEPLLVPRETTKRAGARPRLSGGEAAIDAQALRLLLRLTGLTFLRSCNRVKREHDTLLQADAISQFCPCYTPRRFEPQASVAGFDRWPKGSVFSEHAVSLRTCQVRPIRAHTCSGITWRLCGGLGASVAQDLRALRLWQSSRQWRAVPWSCIDAEPGCRALRRSSVNILTAWPGRVAQAPRAGRARAPWSCSPCWRPSREPHGWRISYSSTTKRTRKSPTEVPPAAAFRVAPPSAICQLPASARPSWSSNKRVLRERTP